MAHLDTNKVRSSQHQQNQTEILEYGDIYFFYRPKVRSEKVKSIEDVRRFFMITASEQRANNSNSDNQIYRLFVVGKKSLPTIRKSEARASERFWARIGGVFKNANELTKELLSDEFRRGDAARPVGEGKYALVKYQNHAEIAYILELPKEPGEAQKELGIEKEASYIISVINPNHPTPTGYPSAEESPKYPEKILKEFDKNGNFVSLSKDTDFINYQNAQVILIGAREGKDELSKEFGVDIEEQVSGKSMDIFKKLNIKRGQISTKPLTEGKLE